MAESNESPRRLSRQLIATSPALLMPSLGLDPMLMRSLSVFSQVFEVAVPRSSLGLGFSIMTETQPFPVLVRIKRVFQYSNSAELLHEGDAILRANGVPMVGLSVRQAVEVLRKGDVHTLTIARFIKEKGGEEAARVYSSVLSTPMRGSSMDVLGAFEVDLEKRRGSLGFTLSYNNHSSALRHTVKTIVKEPALSDGRILPGDKLVEANGVSLDDLDHQQLIAFLRSLPERVRLKLYRDDIEAQTPLSPSGSPPFSSFLGGEQPKRSKSKQLRFEAREMVRSRQASRSSLDRHSSNDSSKPYIVPINVETDDDDDSCHNETSSLPTVEAPETPVREDLCLSLPLIDLKIEEIEDDDNTNNDVVVSVVEVNDDDCDQETSELLCSVMERSSSANVIVPNTSVLLNRFEVSRFGSLPRPRHLDLSQRGRRRRVASFRDECSST